MRTLFTLPLLFCIAAPANAADIFAKGDPKIGKTLHDKSCISCHTSMVGGDGTTMYSRMERKIKTPQKLQAQISACNTNANAGWFPEDELHVGAYLNKQFYRFK
jgi:hypothetical protein